MRTAQEITRSRISSGTAKHPTPTGIFSIIQKSRHHRSNLYSDAPMPYMQRLTWSGVALHQGKLPGYPASHGCIRMPEAFARQMWAASKLGLRVVVTREAVTPADVLASDAVPKQKPKVVAAAPERADPRRAKPGHARTTRARCRRARRSTPTSRPLRRLTNVASRSSIVDGDPGDRAGAGRCRTRLDAASEPASRRPPDAAPCAGGVAAAPQVDAQGRPLRPGPVSVFISRREGKLYVRKQFAPVFEAAITIERPEQAIGTHLFTAIARMIDDSLPLERDHDAGRAAGRCAADQARAEPRLRPTLRSAFRMPTTRSTGSRFRPMSPSPHL